jgi:outer membrane lipoprotein-sorting protein
MKLFRQILILLLAAITPCALAAETASDIIGKCAKRVNGAACIDVAFTINASGNKQNCSMKIAKQKYRMSVPGMEVWYNGSTQWTYTTDKKQLTITDPTADELMETNPFAILNSYAGNYTCKRLADKGTVIELTAKSKASNIRRAVVTINTANYMPSKLVVTMANGHTFTATVTSLKIGSAANASDFVYNKAKYPASETNDLR